MAGVKTPFPLKIKLWVRDFMLKSEGKYAKTQSLKHLKKKEPIWAADNLSKIFTISV